MTIDEWRIKVFYHLIPGSIRLYQSDLCHAKRLEGCD